MTKNIKKIQSNILDRYRENKRNFPRRKTQNPYHIHVSEIMLQQTQAERVIPYYNKWIKKFPNYKTLANGKKIELLSHRSGLGFNSRALRLQECAKIISKKYNGLPPKNKKELMELPGIGPYTSGAIMSFARNKEVPVIDTNIRRILIFLFKLSENISLKELETFDQEIIPKGKSREWHNALMDYGATHLTAKKTKIKSLGKQSKFKGSDRQVRGWIIKQLIKGKNLKLNSIQKEFPTKNIKNILEIMKKDKLIIINNDEIFLE